MFSEKVPDTFICPDAMIIIAAQESILPDEIGNRFIL